MSTDFPNTELEVNVLEWLRQSPTRTPLLSEQLSTPLLEQPTPTPTTTTILDGNPDLNQKIQRVLRNLCGGRHGPLLLQFWTITKKGSRFSLKTQISHSFLVTPNDALSRYWLTSHGNEISLPALSRVSMSDFGWCGSPLATLFLTAYMPYKEICVGMLQIVSYTKETCLQFVREAGVRHRFQTRKEEGLICLDVGLEPWAMQEEGGSEAMSCSSVDSEEFEPEALVDSGVAHRQDNFQVKTGLEVTHRGWLNSGVDSLGGRSDMFRCRT
ncbi:unnamed protein product [Camellia sinensis]